MKLNKKKVFTLALAVCLIALLSMSSLAWFTDDDSVTNDFLFAGSEDQNPDDVFSVDVWEDKTPEDPDGEDKIQDGIEYPAILPGDDLYKEINVENTGAYDQYARVIVTVSDAHIWQELHGEIYVPLNKIATDLSSEFQPWSIEYDAEANTLTYVLYYDHILAVDEVVNLFTNVAIPEAMDRYQAAEMAGGFQIGVVAEAVQTEHVGANAAEAFATVGKAIEAGNRTINVTADNLDEALASGASHIILDESVKGETITLAQDISNVTIDANGTNVKFVVTGVAENVVLTNIVNTDAGNSVKLNGAKPGSSVTVKDSKLLSNAGTGSAAIIAGPNCDLTVENCEITGQGKSYGIYNSGACGALTVTDSTFTNHGSWAIQINNAVNGDLLIDGCTFETPDGVLKVLSGVKGDATFTNNTMIGCKGHDGAGVTALVCSTSAKYSPLVADGTITYAGNTLDGADWAQ